MRGHDHLVEGEERRLAGGLGGEDVEGRTGDVAGLDQVVQRLLVDEAAAGAVDDPHAGPWCARGWCGRGCCGCAR